MPLSVTPAATSWVMVALVVRKPVANSPPPKVATPPLVGKASGPVRLQLADVLQFPAAPVAIQVPLVWAGARVGPANRAATARSGVSRRIECVGRLDRVDMMRFRVVRTVALSCRWGR